jgi:uncharacterized repeat protein (TIGR03803 family)
MHAHSAFTDFSLKSDQSIDQGFVPDSAIQRRLLASSICALSLLLGSACRPSQAQPQFLALNPLVQFNYVNGTNPYSSLVQGSDGNFYGTTNSGGNFNRGTVFMITPAGIHTTLFHFNRINGENPRGLVQGIDGSFYGTTHAGGTNGFGTVFRMTPNCFINILSGFNFTTLISFTGQMGQYPGQFPRAGLVQGSDGYFYGTTFGGGAFRGGTVFRMSPSGSLTSLINFNPGNRNGDGWNPFAGLVQASDRNFYGTTFSGGAGRGTVFRMTPPVNNTPASLSTLASFNATTGYDVPGELMQAGNGYFYGTAQLGGASGAGTIFRFTMPIPGQNPPIATISTLFNFSNINGYPNARLVEGSDGNFYGTTSAFNPGNMPRLCTMSPCGTVFRFSPNLPAPNNTIFIYDFSTSLNRGVDGQNPTAGLVQGTGGSFYGTTQYGGNTAQQCNPLGCGTIFQLSGVIPPPTITSFTPSNGPVGTQFVMTGSGLTGTTSVRFLRNPTLPPRPTAPISPTIPSILPRCMRPRTLQISGSEAVFTVHSSGQQITVTIPNTARTGPITVTTPAGTFTTSTNFVVR